MSECKYVLLDRGVVGDIAVGAGRTKTATKYVELLSRLAVEKMYVFMYEPFGTSSLHRVLDSIEFWQASTIALMTPLDPRDDASLIKATTALIDVPDIAFLVEKFKRGSAGQARERAEIIKYCLQLLFLAMQRTNGLLLPWGPRVELLEAVGAHWGGLSAHGRDDVSGVFDCSGLARMHFPRMVAMNSVVPTSGQTEQRLSNLLGEAFTPFELRGIVSVLLGREALTMLPGDTLPLAEFAQAVLALLVRYGAVTPQFFELLRERRPLRAAGISELEDMWVNLGMNT